MGLGQVRHRRPRQCAQRSRKSGAPAAMMLYLLKRGSSKAGSVIHRTAVRDAFCVFAPWRRVQLWNMLAWTRHHTFFVCSVRPARRVSKYDDVLKNDPLPYGERGLRWLEINSGMIAAKPARGQGGSTKIQTSSRQRTTGSLTRDPPRESLTATNL